MNKSNKIYFFDTYTRRKNLFVPLKPERIKIYTCGPTVYWYQHIGNIRCYIFSDILKRVLLFNNYKVKQVINITDVGHLTSDADEGEDKIEKAAKKESKTAKEISNYYWQIFREDFKKLNIIEPNIWCRATEHIKEQIDLIKKLEEKGYTYKTKDGVYFNTSKINDYGILARLDKGGLEAGRRVEIKEKINITDFVLWKFSEKPGLRQQEWDSPWGIGFPGWHIECSAMAMKYLGYTIDIHTGGIDHIPVHHTNEIAQSETATGKKFVNYWLHCAFLTFKGEKVSKSKGGLYTLSELEEREFPSLSYRYFCLTAHYRKSLDFSLEGLDGAKKSYERLKNIITEIKNDGKINKKYLENFKKAINNDIDTPKALAVFWNFLRDKKAKGKIKTIKEMDKVFGLDLLKNERSLIPEAVKKLIQERLVLREKKRWVDADKIRLKIESQGYKVEDTKNGSRVKR